MPPVVNLLFKFYKHELFRSVRQRYDDFVNAFRPRSRTGVPIEMPVVLINSRHYKGISRGRGAARIILNFYYRRRARGNKRTATVHIEFNGNNAPEINCPKWRAAGPTGAADGRVKPLESKAINDDVLLGRCAVAAAIFEGPGDDIGTKGRDWERGGSCSVNGATAIVSCRRSWRNYRGAGAGIKGEVGQDWSGWWSIVTDGNIEGACSRDTVFVRRSYGYGSRADRESRTVRW